MEEYMFKITLGFLITQFSETLDYIRLIMDCDGQQFNLSNESFSLLCYKICFNLYCKV